MAHKLVEAGKWVFTLFVLLPLALLIVWAILSQTPAVASSIYHSPWIRIGLLLIFVAIVGGTVLGRD